MRISDWSSDVCSSDLESVSFTGGPSVTIKSHHNVGGLPERMNMKLVEPLRELFKDEVRLLGKELGLPDIFVGRHPFPGPGLAIRIPGEVSKERCDILRKADAIYLEEIRNAGLYDAIWQRSEEHTSELQSLMRISYAVFCLKKKTKLK